MEANAAHLNLGEGWFRGITRRNTISRAHCKYSSRYAPLHHYGGHTSSLLCSHALVGAKTLVRPTMVVLADLLHQIIHSR